MKVLETRDSEGTPPAMRRFTIYDEQSGSLVTRLAKPIIDFGSKGNQGRRMTPKTTDLKPLNAIVKPEERELALKLQEQAVIEAELAERELKAEHLRAELGAFERQYLHHVGSLYAELDDLKAQIAARKAADAPSDESARTVAAEARARAEETKATAGEKGTVAPRGFETTPEMKRLYREVAKRVHPDLASETADRARRQVLMAEVNEAYESGDESKLTKILTGYECSPDAVKGDGAGADLIRVIRRISQARARVVEIDVEMEALVRSDLFRLKSRLDEAQSLGRDVLTEMAGKVSEQIARAKSHLERARQMRPNS
ncbi:MAG: J domain-containing protein [Candidatus Acidiferrales bacterium]